jgi:hypothetical protein
LNKKGAPGIGLLVAILLCSSSAPQRAGADEAGFFLECVGHNSLSGLRTQHEIAFYMATAEVDGKRYAVSKTETEFTLTGPIPAHDTVMYINRLTGEFAITPAYVGSASNIHEDSGKNEGCRKASQKF